MRAPGASAFLAATALLAPACAAAVRHPAAAAGLVGGSLALGTCELEGAAHRECSVIGGTVGATFALLAAVATWLGDEDAPRAADYSPAAAEDAPIIRRRTRAPAAAPPAPAPAGAGQAPGCAAPPPAAATVPTAAAVLAEIRATHVADLRRCAAASPRPAGDALAGEVVLAFTVDATGQVVCGTARGLGDEADRCAAAQLGTWRLPAPADGAGRPTAARFELTLRLADD